MTNQEFALALRKLIIEVSYLNQTAHVGSCLSCVDIVAVLYNEILTSDDVFIMSKGHAALTQYAALHLKGILSKEQLYSYGLDGGLSIHCDKDVPGVYCTTGSLGHGAAIGYGVALAKHLKKEPGNVYVLMGDGEAQEGSVKELSYYTCYVPPGERFDENRFMMIHEINGWQGYQDTHDIQPVAPIHRIKELLTDFSLTWRHIYTSKSTPNASGIDAHYKKIDKESYDKEMANA